MKKGLTELVFILDKSGSMSGLESDTIGGFNSMLKKQKVVEGECLITTVLFDDEVRLLHDRANIKAVQPLTEKDYWVGGSTALYDAMGTAMHKIANACRHTDEAYRPEHVLFVVITDGYENSSREYNGSRIRELVSKHKEKDHWKFIYLGANLDAKEAAKDVGIEEEMAQDFIADATGVSLNMDVMSKTVEHVRACGNVPKNWKCSIADDYQARKKHK